MSPRGLLQDKLLRKLCKMEIYIQYIQGADIEDASAGFYAFVKDIFSDKL